MPLTTRLREEVVVLGKRSPHTGAGMGTVWLGPAVGLTLSGFFGAVDSLSKDARGTAAVGAMVSGEKTV